MRLLALVLPALLGVVVSKYVEGESIDFNKYTLGERQMLVFQLYNHVTDAVMYPEIQNAANHFSFEQYESSFSRPDMVKAYVRLFKYGLYPKAKFFSVYDAKQFYEMSVMYQVLYYAKDFDTFYRAACFMRSYANEGMFVRAFSMAMRQREDCYDFYMPAPYEVYPYFFAYSNAIESAQMMKYKNGAFDSKLMAAYGIKQMDKNSFAVEENESYFAGSPQDKFRYFTDDIDLNAYYMFFRYDFPSYGADLMMPMRRERRGEYYFFFYQQLLARYYQEGLMHGVCEIPEVNYYSPMKYGYYPQMKTHQGFVLPARSAYYTMANQYNFDDVSFVEAFENGVQEAVLQGFFVMPEGNNVNLRNPKSVEDFGRFFYEYFVSSYKSKSSNMFFTNYMDFVFKQFFHSNPQFSSFYSMNFETALRDPAFFMQMKHMMSFYKMFKKFMPMYMHEELYFPGVKIENFNADKLITYFDYYDMDASNAMYLNSEEFNSHSESMHAFIRKRRLNHKPFSFTFDFMSDKTADSVVRVFMGPKYDCMGNEYQFSQNYYNFVEIDAFPYKMKAGKNTFVRNSYDFNTKPADCMSSMEFFKSMVSGGKDFPFNNEKRERCMMGFPDRLLFPKGSAGGYEMRFFVIVSPVSGFPEADYPCDKFRSTYCYDNRAFGFPFDRYFDESYLVPNMFYKDFFIYHEESEVQKNIVPGHSHGKSFYNH